jgi:DNA replication protein DnaC
MAKIKLLIIDEWLRDPMCQNHTREILDLVDDRYHKTATIFCSQLPIKSWHENIKDPTLADAILDRIVHNSHRIELKGESMRKKG